ncbi:hypothetical protein PR003_g12240 [Phytophthora rubi]|uniref:Uncharacterized protein n=1 Tax=Phytophthora rubi TaxID=129364 RepID=A0A6A4F8Y3_9STRA|nr:hypothetical protein PR003_g12240 [Phytophthora rubi]
MFGSPLAPNSHRLEARIQKHDDGKSVDAEDLPNFKLDPPWWHQGGSSYQVGAADWSRRFRDLTSGRVQPRL